jgi:hypothetical protein
MNDLRTAAQRALEALNKLYLPGELERVNAAITALRAALAQQDEPLNLRDPAVQKRLATQWGYVPAAQAEPVGEILPNWSTEQERIVGTWAYLNDLGTNLPVGTKLYTAPPQRKLVPLTEAEIEHIGITHQSLRQVARAVERAVWEKNNG